MHRLYMDMTMLINRHYFDIVNIAYEDTTEWKEILIMKLTISLSMPFELEMFLPC